MVAFLVSAVSMWEQVWERDLELPRITYGVLVLCDPPSATARARTGRRVGNRR